MEMRMREETRTISPWTAINKPSSVGHRNRLLRLGNSRSGMTCVGFKPRNFRYWLRQTISRTIHMKARQVDARSSKRPR